MAEDNAKLSDKWSTVHTQPVYDPATLRRPCPLWGHFLRAAADWLTAKRLKTYGVSLPLAAVTVLLIDSLAKQSLWFLYKGDFILYYTGGKYFLANRLDRLYDFAAQEIFQSDVLTLKPPQLTPFNHPPFTTIFYAPFAVGSFGVGLLFWSLTGFLALALAWHLLRRELTALSVYSCLMLTLLSFCFYPTIAWLLANQNSSFTFLIYTITFVQLRRGRDLAAGISLGLLLYKPQLALTPLFILLIKGRMKALVGFALAGSALIALGFMLCPRAMLDYIRVLPQIAELPFMTGYPVEKMHNFYGFSVLLLGRLFTARVVELIALSVTAAALLAVVAWWRRVPWLPATRQWDLNVASTWALGLLISPHLMIYDLMVLLLPVCIIAAAYSDKGSDCVLDGGPLLVWTALVFATAFVSTCSTSAMLQVTAAIGLPKFAVQVSVPIIFTWAVAVHRAAAGTEELCTIG